MFDELDNEMFAFLIFAALTLGLLGAFIQLYFFSLIKRIFPLTKTSCFLLILLVELGYMNIVYLQMEGSFLTWNVISSFLGKSDGYNLKGAISMHAAIFISSFIGTFLLNQKYLKRENKEGY